MRDFADNLKILAWICAVVILNSCSDKTAGIGDGEAFSFEVSKNGRVYNGTCSYSYDESGQLYFLPVPIVSSGDFSSGGVSLGGVEALGRIRVSSGSHSSAQSPNTIVLLTLEKKWSVIGNIDPSEFVQSAGKAHRAATERRLKEIIVANIP